MSRYVTVNITAQTKAVSQKGFGMPLILATSKEHAYKEYNDLASVAEDFTTTTEEYKIASAIFGQTPKVEKLAIYGINYDTDTGSLPSDLSAALNTLVVDHNDFYFLVSPEQGASEVTELSNWINTQEKMYFVSTDDQAVYGGLNSERTVVLVSKTPLEYPAEAWVGKGGPYLPGSITWTFKTLNGISNAGYTPSEVTAIEDAGGNSYIKEGGILITSTSKTTSGDYIDIIRSRDFMKARIEEGVFRLLATSNKVPFTNAGIAQVTSVVESVMKTSYTQGIIADDENGVPIYTVSAPTRNEVPVNDRANRHLPNVNFDAVIAGAIEKVRISGVIRV